MEEALAALVTLFVIIDPIGTTPLFIALTAEHDTAGKRRVARLAILVSFGVLTVFGLAGEAVLAFAGISLPAFRIAGGLLLFLTAIDMLFETRTQRREKRVADEKASPSDPAVFPLAIPLIAGPGSIAAMILLTGEAGPEPADQAVVFAVMAAVLALQFVLFRLGGPIARVLGRTGSTVITRLMGMLLAALAVQFVLDGLRDALPGLGGS
ncbi:MAG: MarC family protein [Pseudomonadota bacterium]